MSTGSPDFQESPSRNLAFARMLLVFAGVGIVFSMVYLYTVPFDKMLTMSSPNKAVGSSSLLSTNAPDPGVPLPETPIVYLETGDALVQVELLEFQGKVNDIRDQLRRLQALQADWQPLSKSLLTDNPGRKVAESPEHVKLILEAFETDAVSSRQILQWEHQLAALEEPLNRVSRDGLKVNRIAGDYQRKLDDLGQTVSKALNQVQQQQRVVQSVMRETESLLPDERTLEQALDELRQQMERDSVERLSRARAEARKRAEVAKIATVTRLEAEVVAAEEKRQAAELQAERERVEALAREEQEQRIAEGKIREAQQRATLAGLEAKATEVEDALQRAQLEREFQRDLPLIKSHLIAFTAPGRSRRDFGEGPISWAYIQGRGAMTQSRLGLQYLGEVAGGANDRPLGAIPPNLDQNAYAILEQAQNLLQKYGPLMVEKGMLDP